MAIRVRTSQEVSDALARVYASAPMDDRYVETLELSHSGLSGGVRYITNEREGFQGTLEDGSTVVTFDAVPFESVPPRSEEEGQVRQQIVLDNAGLQLMSELESMADTPEEPIIVTYRVYLYSDRTVVQNNPPRVLEVLNAKATNQSVSFNAGLANLRDKPFPAQLYTIELFPGLKR